jgi:hypothetical protein
VGEVKAATKLTDPKAMSTVSIAAPQNGASSMSRAPMTASSRPFLALYVVWHPKFAEGKIAAKKLYDHYRRELYENVAGGTGLSVQYRSAPGPTSAAPLEIDFGESETTAVVLLFDENFAADADYVSWATRLLASADTAGLGARVLPVAFDGALTRVGLMEQAVRWDKWTGMSSESRYQRLTTDLTYQFCRMLRLYLEKLKRPLEDDEALMQYLKKVQIFLSHSKRDADGERIAKLVRGALLEENGLATFFDVYDIPTGVRFDTVILSMVRVSAVVAIHTDSFSSREWCRREIIEAKRANVPLVVANCIADTDERGFPYMGNVPVVRMDPGSVNRIDRVVGRLLDEVLKDFLWRCRVALIGLASSGTIFLPRPPELISLSALNPTAHATTTLVYPDPPLGAEEQRLFETIAPNARLRSLTEWVAEQTAKP